ncbi:MAG: ABC transporter permease [Methanosarcinaceae archaeon]|nr:ABC transporter permease [Methanosarcinaceae archaeon]
MSKITTVAMYEFMKIVKRKEFVLMTIGFPLLFVIVTAIPILLLSQAGPDDQVFGYIDKMDMFEFPENVTNLHPSIGPIPAKISIHTYIRLNRTYESSLLLKSGDIRGFIIIPEDYMETGIIKAFGKDIPTEEISDILVDNLLIGMADKEKGLRIKEPITLKRYVVDEKTDKVRELGLPDVINKIAMPFIIAVLLFITIFSSSGYLIQGVAEEKESKIIEILLSSVTTGQLLAGKIIGLGAIGLVQLCIWLLVSIFASSMFLPQFAFKIYLIILAFVYFLLGYMLIATFMATIGSISSSLRESQQLAGLFTFAAILPLMFMQILLTKPDSNMSVFLSIFPMTSPVAMLVRIGSTNVPFHQILASVLILVLSTYIVLIIGARIFRMGVLMYGKRPTIRDIIRFTINPESE